jgi:pSer/pThr/pTyr-binding forkhead associated (FHA) protein
MPKVIVSIDGVVIKQVTLVKNRTTLGRRPYNDIVIDNLAVSGEHAVLQMVGTDVYLEDCNSTNGTYVNSRAIKKQALVHNDIIEVGKHKIRYFARASAPAPTARTKALSPAAAPISSTGTPALPASLGGRTIGAALIRELSGADAGLERPLKKVVTIIGTPGVAVAAVTRRIKGYVIAPMEGDTLLNGKRLGTDAVALHHGDLLELGGVRMQFVHA